MTSLEILKAWKKSIEKWKNITKGAIDHGGHDCAFCKLTLDHDDGYCRYCPVHEKSGGGCEPTPYSRWVKHQQEYHSCFINFSIRCPTCAELAHLELEFLESLWD